MVVVFWFGTLDKYMYQSKQERHVPIDYIKKKFKKKNKVAKKLSNQNLMEGK